jgi:long-chain acyl-CoA synthetase
MNIVSEIFKRNPDDRLAVLHEGGSLTFGQLREQVTRLTTRLRSHSDWPTTGIPRVALSHPSGPEYIANALSILQAGGCFLPIPDELTLRERDELLDLTSAHLILTRDGDLRKIECGKRPSFPETELANLNPAFIRFSSGTTGRAKGIVLSHHSLLARITAANSALKIKPGDRVLWMLPMAHHFAVSIVLYLYYGATTVLVPSGNAAGLLKPSREHQVSVIYGSPYHFAMLAAEPDAGTLPSLRLAVSTAFPLPDTTARAFQSAYGIPLQQGLGIIEAGLPLLNQDAAESKPTSIGKTTPAFEARIDDATGELFIRGPGMLDAYLSPWQTQSSILQDGWLSTGDIAERDMDGHYFLKGRTRSVINVGGLKCFPEEVESILRQHPTISAARVFARLHPGLGAVPVAEIVLKPELPAPSPLDLKRHCQQHLASYKVPILFQTVSCLPLTSSGKILRTTGP